MFSFNDICESLKTNCVDSVHIWLDPLPPYYFDWVLVIYVNVNAIWWNEGVIREKNSLDMVQVVGGQFSTLVWILGKLINFKDCQLLNKNNL